MAVSNAPAIFHKRMQRRASGDYSLSRGKLKLRLVRNPRQRWNFGIYAPSLGLSGFLMSDQDWDSAVRAGEALELALSDLAIGLVTELRRTTGRTPKRTKQSK